MTDFWRERFRIQDARSEKQRELMQEYDKRTYLPAMNDLRERCAAAGHSPDRDYHNNGLGVVFEDCRWCGAQVALHRDGGREPQ